jgi:hypothetical protein
MKKVPFGCRHKKYWTNESVLSISAPSKKFWFTRRILHQNIPPRNRIPFCSNFLILNLEDKAFFQGGGHVRDLTPHVDRIIYSPCNKG